MIRVAVWVWSAEPPTELRDFTRDQGLAEVYLATPHQPTPDEAERIKRTVRVLHEDGVLVSALGGGTSWVFQQDRALEWARAARRTANFDGLHLDVEPHSIDRWPEHADTIISRYLRMLELVRPLTYRLHVDVGFSYGEHQAPGGNFADEVLARVDGVTVMSYRDQARGPNSLLAIARDWLRRARQANRPIRLAVETNPSAEGEHVTFAEEGEAAMRRVTRAVDAELRDHPTYAGFAVHDYRGWLALPP